MPVLHDKGRRGLLRGPPGVLQSLGSGQYVYTLPRTSLAALRLDPCSPEENKAVTLTMSNITLQRRRHPARRMAVFCADVVSGVLSGALPRTGRRCGEHGWGRGYGEREKIILGSRRTLPRRWSTRLLCIAAPRPCAAALERCACRKAAGRACPAPTFYAGERFTPPRGVFRCHRRARSGQDRSLQTTRYRCIAGRDDRLSKRCAHPLVLSAREVPRRGGGREPVP